MESDTKLSLFKEKLFTKGKPPHLFSEAYFNQISSPVESDQARAEINARESNLARMSAIKHQNISIMALAGQEITFSDLELKYFWESDPYPNLESQIISNKINVIGGKASFFGGEANLWKYLSMTANEITQETNNPLDILSLTPTEAIYLIGELVRRRLNYDDLIANYISQEKIDENKISTGRPDILKHFTKKPKKFQQLSKQYSTSVNYKKADQLIEHGFVVCRHIAAISSILYEVLRSKQQNILMNGSYLIYHDERLGEQKQKASVDMHSYNILYTTHPTTSSPEVYISVLDPTYIVNSNPEMANPDFTNIRISQACSSLYEYGNLFNIPKTKDTVQSLATLALNRIKKSSKSGADYNDFISLEFQAHKGDSVKALNDAFNHLVQCGNTRTELLIELLQNPPATYQSIKYNSTLRLSWLPGIIDQINKLEIYYYEIDNIKILLNLLENHVSQISTDYLLKDNSGYLWKFLTAYHDLCKKYNKNTLKPESV